MMNEFDQLTQKAFENYHNTPYESEWGFTEAIGHIMEFLEHHDSIDEMPGLRAAIQTLSLKDWENWYTRYPEHRDNIIEPLHKEITEHAQ